MLGKNIKEICNKNVALRIPEIIVLFQSYCGPCNNRKSSPETVTPIRELLSEAKRADENLARKMTSTLVFLPLIAKNLKKMNCIF